MEQILLAPNGKLSNLTPEQYRLVRTKEFKEFFGDWEKHPEKSSKIVDSNGEPMVMYRGNRKNQEELGYEFRLGHNFLNKENSNDFGFFFTNDIDVAKKYVLVNWRDEVLGGSITSVFLKANNIFDLTELGILSSPREFSLYLDQNVSFDGYEQLKEKINDYDYFTYEGFGANVYDYFDLFPELKDLFQDRGYDAVVFKEKSRSYFPYLTYVVFNSNQIKLSDGTNTTFDSNNPDIRFDRGGVIDSDIIRISKEVVNQIGERYSDTDNIGMCKEISDEIADRLNARGIQAIAMRIVDGQDKKYNSVVFNHAYTFLPNTSQIVDTQLWQLQGQPDNLQARKVLFNWDEYNDIVELYDVEPINEWECRMSSHFDKGGRTIAQTLAPKSDRIYGSKLNKENSAKDIKSAKRIVFDKSTNQKIANKVATHNKKHQGKEIPIEVAKAVVRRGMGAYSNTHRPTISKGNPNSRVAWGLARLDAFIYKIVHGTSKSGRYSQDNDLIEELGYKVKKYDEGGNIDEFYIGKTYSGKQVRDIVSKYESQEGTDMEGFAVSHIKIKDKYILDYVEIEGLIRKDSSLHTFITLQYNPNNDVDYEDIRQPILLGTDEYSKQKNIVLDGYHRILQQLYNKESKIFAFIPFNSSDIRFDEGGNVCGFENSKYMAGGLTIRPNKVVNDLQSEIKAVQNELIDNSNFSDTLKDLLRNVRSYVVDSRRGRAYYKKGFFSVPLWAYKVSKLTKEEYQKAYEKNPKWYEDKKDISGYFIYYVAHELAHFVCYYTNSKLSDCNGHNKNFYDAFKKLCPYKYQYYELGYIKGSTKFGVPTYDQCVVIPAEEQTPQTEHCGDNETTINKETMNRNNLAVGDIVIEQYNDTKFADGKFKGKVKGEIVSIDDAMAKVSFGTDGHEEWIPLTNLVRYEDLQKDTITETANEMKSEKQQMKDIIELLRDSLEYMDDSKEILTTQDLIQTLEESLEFMDGDDDTDNINDDMNEEEQIEVVEQKSDYTPAYLMTLDEYNESGIIPLITEYSKFVSKNKQWLKGSYYGNKGLELYSLEQHIELGNKSPMYFAGYGGEKNFERRIKEQFFDNKIPKIIEQTPQNILDQQKEYQRKLAKYFNSKELSLIDLSKDKKSNKRIVKSAVDNDTYYNLVKNNELTIDRVREITDSVDVRMTKKILSADKKEEFKDEMKKELSRIPAKNYEELMKFSDIIYNDLKPVGDIVYEREYNRYLEFINKSVGETYSSPSLSRALGIWRDVFTYTKTPVYKKNRYGRDILEYDNITIKSISYENQWKPKLIKFIEEYVLSLKFSIVKAMITQFQYIKLPLKSLERIFIRLGIKGFEGEYKFIFEDGSSFVLETRGIGAGGYNIQVYHYRYIINMRDYQLSDGTKTDYTHFR